jgi:hypothetical protein
MVRRIRQKSIARLGKRGNYGLYAPKCTSSSRTGFSAGLDLILRRRHDDCHIGLSEEIKPLL